MKKFFYHFLFLNILLISPFSFSYGMDCSAYDDLISITETQINNLKMRSARDGLTAQNAQQKIYAPIGSKYQDEYNKLQQQYDNYQQQKLNCLLNNLSYTSYTTNTSYNSTSSSFTANENKFMTLLEYAKDKTDNNDSIGALQYLIDAENYCNKNDVYKTFKNICDKLPSTIAKSYAIACFDSYQSKKYTEAKEYCYQSIMIDNKQYTPYISLGVIFLDEKDYGTAKSYFDAAYANATTEEQRETARQYVEEAHKHMPTENDFGFSDEVLAILNKSLFCDEGYVYDSKINKCITLGEDCSKGYIYNELKNECVPDTTEQRARNCSARYGKSSLANNGEDCICDDGYVFDEGVDKCLINLNEKSLESRIINTKDAECDNIVVQAMCKGDPTGDDCPAVCLELYDAINWMYDNELTIYNDPTQFGIYDPITREQASKFFVNFYMAAFDKKPFVTATNPFKDIDNADPTLRMYIINSYTLKLFKGTNGKFMPFSHLTKAQALAVMIRMATGILDESQQPRYSNYLYTAESMDLLDNISYSYTTLDNEDIIRGDVALILYRLYEYLENN